MGTQKLVGNDTLSVFYCVWFQREALLNIIGGHLGFDLSRASEVKSDFPPNLKMNLIV